MRIIVVGAGIGGLSCALALARQGHAVVVLESAPQLAEIGAGVQLTPNAIKFFVRWGMRDDILAKAAMPTSFFIHDGIRGDVLREVKISELEGQYGAPYVVVHRGVLHAILHRHVVAAGAEVRVNANVVHYDFDGGRVALEGGPTLQGDLVVACDGINSFARKQFLGHHDRESERTGWAAYRMLVDVARIRADPRTADLVSQHHNHLWIGENLSAMTYMIYESTMLNMVMSHPDDVDTADWAPQQSLSQVKSLFAGWDERLTALIDMVKPTVQNWPVYQVSPLPRWVADSGRFVLMGDAAHAMAFYLSMGISLAVEDAVALAECLSLLLRSRSPSPPPSPSLHHNEPPTFPSKVQAPTNGFPRPTLSSALALFESIRKPRCEAVQRESLRAGNVLHLPTGPGQRLRDQAMQNDGSLGDEDRPFSYGIADRHTRDWCYGYDAAEEVASAWERRFGRTRVT